MSTRRQNAKNEIDEHVQESFSEEHVNVDCVASWRLDPSKRLTIDFHNGWHFDSNGSARKPDQIKSAIVELKRIS
jgi:hypothetical protein